MTLLHEQKLQRIDYKRNKNILFLSSNKFTIQNTLLARTGEQTLSQRTRKAYSARFEARNDINVVLNRPAGQI